MSQTINDRIPNFRRPNGSLVLLRCYACTEPDKGVENYIPAVWTGQCAWCGWREQYKEETKPECDTE